MDSQDVFVGAIERIRDHFMTVTDGLEYDSLVFRAAPESTTIAWLLWHLTRVQDHDVSLMAGVPQRWMADHWYRRFALPPDQADVGRGYGPEQVDTIRPESASLLSEYHAAVAANTIRFLRSTNPSSFNTRLSTNVEAHVTVGDQLIDVLSDGFEHVGTVRYLRRITDRRTT